MHKGKAKTVPPDAIKTKEIEKFFVIFGVVGDGAQTTGQFELYEKQYELTKKQIKDKVVIIHLHPVVEIDKKEVEADLMSINTEKYAFITTEKRVIKVEDKSTIIDPGTGKPVMKRVS